MEPIDEPTPTVAPVPTEIGPPPSGLPTTGPAAGPLVTVGLGVLAFGAILVTVVGIVTRRRPFTK